MYRIYNLDLLQIAPLFPTFWTPLLPASTAHNSFFFFYSKKKKGLRSQVLRVCAEVFWWPPKHGQEHTYILLRWQGRDQLLLSKAESGCCSPKHSIYVTVLVMQSCAFLVIIFILIFFFLVLLNGVEKEQHSFCFYSQIPLPTFNSILFPNFLFFFLACFPKELAIVIAKGLFWVTEGDRLSSNTVSSKVTEKPVFRAFFFFFSLFFLLLCPFSMYVYCVTVLSLILSFDFCRPRSPFERSRANKEEKGCVGFFLCCGLCL